MSETVKDSKGRSLRLRTLGVLEQARMLRAIGAAQSQNMPYVHMVECALMVAAIDEVPVAFPQNENQIDSLLKQLGDEGVTAMMVHRIAQIKSTADAEEAAAAGGNAADPLAPSA